MATGPIDRHSLSPEEAFAALGNEVRTTVLLGLARADTPLSFSELRAETGIDDPGQLNYHLDQLREHFIVSTDTGYELTDRGKRIVTAVLAGAVTEVETISPTPIDVSCTYCDGTLEAAYNGERVIVACPSCDGAFGDQPTDLWDDDDVGYIGSLTLPPAGTTGRDVEALHAAAQTWGYQRFLSVANDLCPDCSAKLEANPVVCTDHDTANGICERCKRRHAVQLHSECPNCIFAFNGLFVVHLLANTELLAFFTQRGINFVSPDGNPWAKFTVDETVDSTDPLEATFTFTVDDDAISLTVDESLSVIAVEYPDPP